MWVSGGGRGHGQYLIILFTFFPSFLLSFQLSMLRSFIHRLFVLYAGLSVFRYLCQLSILLFVFINLFYFPQTSFYFALLRRGFSSKFQFQVPGSSFQFQSPVPPSSSKSQFQLLVPISNYNFQHHAPVSISGSKFQFQFLVPGSSSNIQFQDPVPIYNFSVQFRIPASVSSSRFQF